MLQKYKNRFFTNISIYSFIEIGTIFMYIAGKILIQYKYQFYEESLDTHTIGYAGYKSTKNFK